ncbi:MAG: hypothetical protein EBU85_07510 [Actinobacteria bacterium]|nr:hypothetical protein [Actinomycetota bacterium]
MPTLKIDNKDYELDNLSPEAKAQLQMLQVTDQEIARLNVQLAIAQTARSAYSQALKASLPAASDTIQLPQ